MWKHKYTKTATDLLHWLTGEDILHLYENMDYHLCLHIFLLSSNILSFIFSLVYKKAIRNLLVGEETGNPLPGRWGKWYFKNTQ